MVHSAEERSSLIPKATRTESIGELKASYTGAAPQGTPQQGATLWLNSKAISLFLVVSLISMNPRQVRKTLCIIHPMMLQACGKFS